LFTPRALQAGWEGCREGCSRGGSQGSQGVGKGVGKGFPRVVPGVVPGVHPGRGFREGVPECFRRVFPGWFPGSWEGWFGGFPGVENGVTFWGWSLQCRHCSGQARKRSRFRGRFGTLPEGGSDLVGVSRTASPRIDQIRRAALPAEPATLGWRETGPLSHPLGAPQTEPVWGGSGAPSGTSLSTPPEPPSGRVVWRVGK